MNKRMNRIIRITIVVAITALLLQGCGGKLGNIEKDPVSGTQLSQNDTAKPEGTPETDSVTDSTADQTTGDTADNNDDQSDGNAAETTGQQSTAAPIDLNAVKPNEAGRIMVVMFHNFVEEYIKGDKAYTTTFGEFEKLLETLYDMDYRLVSMNDYLSGNIDTPAGCIPMVFTFDDGTAGQFNLIEEGGALVVNPRSAVGIMEKFHETHLDFGTKGTFYINLGNQTFPGAGTVAQRLEYLKSKGFELGNHTYSHINLKETKSADKIVEEIGGNQKKMLELIPDYLFTTFSLPYGAPAKDLTQHVIKGEYEGVRYENLGIMEVGWDPAPSPFSVKFNPLSTHRVRSSGITPVDQDLAWWLANMKRDNQYVSDGNPDTVTIPESYTDYVNHDMIGDRKVVTY